MKVLVYQRVLPHYRQAFFLKLNEQLSKSGGSLSLIYGSEMPNTVPKTVDFTSDFSKYVNTKYLSFLNFEIVWLPIELKWLLSADVVVIEQANRIISNYFVVFLCFVLGKKIVYWGHGMNYQAKKPSFLGKFKQFYTGFSSGFIAYTKGGCDYLIANGYNSEKTFFVNNSVDIQLPTKISHQYSDDTQFLNNSIFPTTNMAVYCGGMYKHKRLNFLLDAVILIKKYIPDFSLVLIGDGPDADLAINFANEHSDWVHYAGFLVGEEKSRVFSKAKLQFMPGLVGLAVIDSFVFEVPLVTTNIDYHSPEFEYIKNGENGIVTEDSVTSYALSVVDYLKDEEKLLELKRGCRDSSKIYTVDNMVVNFSNAILKIMGINHA